MAFNLLLIVLFNKNLFYTGTLLKRIIISNPTNINNCYNNIVIYVISGIKRLINIRIIRRTGVPGLNIRVIQSRNY